MEEGIIWDYWLLQFEDKGTDKKETTRGNF